MDILKRCFAFAALVMAALIVASCGEHPKSAATEPVSYAVPVATGCVAKDGRPAPPQPLNRRYTAEQWAAMPPGAKAQAVAAQGGERMNFEDRDRAATAACR